MVMEVWQILYISGGLLLELVRNVCPILVLVRTNSFKDVYYSLTVFLKLFSQFVTGVESQECCYDKRILLWIEIYMSEEMVQYGIVLLARSAALLISLISVGRNPHEFIIFMWIY